MCRGLEKLVNVCYIGVYHERSVCKMVLFIMFFDQVKYRYINYIQFWVLLFCISNPEEDAYPRMWPKMKASSKLCLPCDHK